MDNSYATISEIPDIQKADSFECEQLELSGIGRSNFIYNYFINLLYKI